jgi:hypothetical protein
VVESHLSPRALKLRALLVFFAAGGALFAAKRLLSGPEPKPVLVVSVPAEAQEDEVERAIDEAVLLDQALARGGALVDPVVREQLLRMRVTTLNPEREEEGALLDRAMALGVHRADPLIRARLAFQAQQVLRATAEVPPPTDDELERYRKEHAARYREAARVSFTHVFVSRSRHGAALEDKAAQVQAELAREQPAPEQAFRFSDPSILPRSMARATEREIAARFGAEFGRQVFAAAADGWQGPIPSSYGLHFVRITGREAERLPSLEELRRRLTTDYVHDRKEAAARRRLKELRESYRIELRRAGA